MRENVDPAELAKFSALAHRWWDPTSEFRPLHEINPLRLAHIERIVGEGGASTVYDFAYNTSLMQLLPGEHRLPPPASP